VKSVKIGQELMQGVKSTQAMSLPKERFGPFPSSAAWFPWMPSISITGAGHASDPVSPPSFVPSAIRAVFTAILLSALMFCSPMYGQAASQPAAVRPLIAQTVDESQLTTLKGNTHPLSRPQFDLGTAPASLPMQRMLPVLKRPPEQETALKTLLDDQQDKSSPSYHQWLTPEQYGQQFGPTDTDLQTITVWLQSHGFQVGSTKGRTVLEFSGTAGQVQAAFHTMMDKYIVNGEQH
jgi:hypothetical protein